MGTIVHGPCLLYDSLSSVGGNRLDSYVTSKPLFARRPFMFHVSDTYGLLTRSLRVRARWSAKRRQINGTLVLGHAPAHYAQTSRCRRVAISRAIREVDMSRSKPQPVLSMRYHVGEVIRLSFRLSSSFAIIY